MAPGRPFSPSGISVKKICFILGILGFALSIYHINRSIILLCFGYRNTAAAEAGRRRFLIYICDNSMHCGGWGDRQRGIVSSYIIANATGRKFGIEMTKPCDISRYMTPNAIDWTVQQAALAKLTRRHLNFLNVKRSVATFASIDFDREFPEDVVYLTTNLRYWAAIMSNRRYEKALEWMRNMAEWEAFRKIFLDLFRPTETLQRELDEFAAKAMWNSTKLVCAQIRIGKNPTIPKDQVRNSFSSVRNVWQFIRKYDSDRHRIFVTTDAEEVRRTAKRLFPRRILDTEGAIIHVDRYYSRTLFDLCKAMEKTLLDQLILTTCDVLVVSKSTYGKNAMFLKKSPGNIYLFNNEKITPLKFQKRKPSFH